MRNFFKKITAVIMSFMFIAGAIPIAGVDEAYAKVGEELRFITPENAPGQYDLTFSFPSYVPADDDTLAGYIIYYRNLTKGETYAEPRIIRGNGTGDIISIASTLTLDPGSLYTFSVRPIVSRPFIVNNEEVRRNVELSEISAFSALTNIAVSAIGENNSMTVTWDYPSLPGNAPFFTSYNIYYANIDGNTTQPLQWSTNVINASVANLEIAEGKATYTLTSNDFQVGRIYAIRIEPVFGSLERSDLVSELDIGSYGRHNFRSDLSVHYLTDRAYIRPAVTLETNSLTNINVSWDSLANKPLSGYIRQVIVYEVTNNERQRIVTIDGADAAIVTSANPTKPKSGQATYYVEVVYADISYMGANGLTVDPYNVTVVSTEALYDPGALEFEPYRPDILEISDSRAKPFTLDVTWKAFYRDPLNELETDNSNIVNGVPKFLDKDITYEIAITDDPANFEFMDAGNSYIVDGRGLAEEYINNYPYYSYNFNNYFTRSAEGVMEETAFQQNKIYYVRIRAVRDATDEESKDAFGSHYIMPVERIPVVPSMIARPPLRIKKVEGIEVVDDESITVEWDEEWIELYNPDDGNWYSKVSVAEGKILYGDDVKDNMNNVLVENRSIVNGYISKTDSRDRVLSALGLDQNDPADLPYTAIRLVDIKGANYKMHVVEYDILTQFGYDDYYAEIIEDDTSYEWQDVTPTSSGTITKEYKVVDSHNEPASPLKSGIPYVIFVRPYFSSDEGDKLAYYPSYVTATTLKDRNDMDIEPTVPILEAVSSTDTSITVRWKYTQELTYELRIDERYANYPDGGRNITPEDVAANGILMNDEATGQLYMQLTIDRLYPNTLYYVWIRSAAKNATGGEPSDWSNAVEIKTLDIAPPDPPRGLGLASKGSLNIYNQGNGTQLEPSTLEYLIVEWMRINADMNNPAGEGEEGPVAAAPGGGGEGSGLTEYLENPEVPGTYMAKFNELIANRQYHIRAKTRLVIIKEEDGSSSKQYTYIVQISLDPGFTDFTEIEVPETSDITEGIYKDSEWVSIILLTEKTDGEYDGDKNPDLYPLPDQDFEIIYDNATNTLTYRFRGIGKDEDGNNDNQVDERFISRLISNRVFDYKLDLSSYGSRTPKIRIVEFPYSIIKAFNERKISLTVKAANYTVTFPYESFLTSEVKGFGNLDKSAKLTVNITQNPDGIVAPENINYTSVPHKLSTTLTTPKTVYNYQYYAKPLNMNLTVSGQYVEGATNIGAYVQDGNTAGWQRLNGKFDTVTKSVDFVSQKTANYSSLGLVTPWAYDGATVQSMYNVNSKLNVSDIGTYNELQGIMKGQMNQLMAAALKSSPSVVMNTNLSGEDKGFLEKTGLLFTGSGNDFVTREEGISKLVRLFEIKTKYPVTGYPSLNETGYSDISLAGQNYHIPLLKAVELGFYREGSANLKGNLTFGDTMHILDIILSY